MAQRQTNRQLQTDEELVKLAYHDAEYFGVLIERHELKLLRFVRRISGFDQQCVEDVVQNVFLKAFQNLQGFNLKLSFSSWIYRIARNEAINYHKKKNGRDWVSLEIEDEVGTLIDVLASDDDIVLEAINRETKLRIRKMMQSMDDKYREVLVLKFLEEKSYEEISDILRKPMGSVATLVNRAKKQFKMLAEKNNLLDYLAA